MSQYRDEQQAVVRAVNAGEGRPKPAQWQGLYVAGYRESSVGDSDLLEGIDKLLADSMARALIHRALPHDQWLLMIAMYSGNESEQIGAIDNLARTIESLAGPRNRRVWIACHVSKAMAQKYGRTSYDWDGNATAESTLRRWRTDIHKRLEIIRSAAFSHLRIVLKDAGLTPVSG